MHVPAQADFIGRGPSVWWRASGFLGEDF